MAKLIIEYPDDMPTVDAVWRALQVVCVGRISGNNTHFCWVTRLKDGTYVYTRRKRLGQTSDSLIVSYPG